MTAASVELDDLYENAWHSVAKPPRRRSGTTFSRFILPTARLPFVACNELAIATKSIASVLSPATRTSWVPSKYAEGERRYGRDALNNTSCECVVAKANEADCLANAEVQTREEGGNYNFRVHAIHSCREITKSLCQS